jgi:hypothetical protein
MVRNFKSGDDDCVHVGMRAEVVRTCAWMGSAGAPVKFLVRPCVHDVVM